MDARPYLCVSLGIELAAALHGKHLYLLGHRHQLSGPELPARVSLSPFIYVHGCMKRSLIQLNELDSPSWYFKAKQIFILPVC